MTNRILEVSIIIVHYNVKEELFSCIDSIYKSKPKVSFEIIVVDNDEVKVIKEDLLKRFPKVKYIENKNNGWGGGTNKGAKHAKGEYLYLLNPDTLFLNNALDKVVEFAERNEKTGVVSSMLYDKSKKVYPLQGTKILNPLNAIFSLSIINKLFPNNLVSRKFWMKGWDKSEIKQVDVATLSAALIKKEDFKKAGGFDENLFLYYEEYDLSKRLKKLNLKNYILPSSKVIHIWEASTKKTGKTNEFIENSRKYYFKKYYGAFIAGFVEFFLSLNRELIIAYVCLLSIIGLAIVLRFDRINSYVPFIGDQAWFYLSARNMILNGEVPLLGIASSHPWIHQGPLWTYLLAPVLAISNFNPISGIYLSNLFGIGSVVLAFVVGRRFISTRFGLIFSFIFAASPLVVYHSRFAYHTSPIPFFVLLLSYFLCKWISGRVLFFPLIIFTMFILYNFELATVIFWPVIVFYLTYGFLRRKEYALKLVNRNIFFLSVLAFIMPMIPILIHDFQNGFSQTIVFAGWFFYKGFQFLGLIPKSPIDESSIESAAKFFFDKYHTLIFPLNKVFAYIIFFSTLIASLSILIKKNSQAQSWSLTLLTIIGLTAYFASGVPSEAYLVMLFPGLLFILAYIIYQLKNTALILTIIVIISGTSIYYLTTTNYLTKNTITLSEKISASEKILKLTNISDLNLIYKGPGQEFESSIMPYEYLLWWKGGVNQSENGRKVLVEEREGTIIINVINE